ncbi:NAD-dependent epimerase/dehydratase family protein [Streptomyces sp. NPDC090021]|uniref:NAD-dependent epimerase/dehydratase family protein n=1 Tax=Streptomyces sp. NPDC090021 TaxID=3365919 RepID=UPI0038029B9A
MEVIGHGFIARHLAALAAPGTEAAPDDRHPDVTVIAAGVSSTRVCAEPEFRREADLVAAVAERCRAEGRTVVFLSTASAALYGGGDGTGQEESPPAPVSAYGRHKAAVEGLVANSGARWVVLRLSHLIGHGQHAEQLLPALTRQIESGSVTVYRGAYRDVLDVEHFVALTDRILAAGVRDEIVNVASGVSEPVELIVDGIERRLGVTARRTFVDAPANSAPVSVAKLRGIVPGLDGFGFGPAYLPRLLDRYVRPTSAAPVPRQARSVRAWTLT